MNLCRVQSKQEEAAGSHCQPRDCPMVLELDLSFTLHLPETSASPHLLETKPGPKWRQPQNPSQEMLKATVQMPCSRFPELMPTHWARPPLVEVMMACHPLAALPSLPYHIDEQGDQKEELTKERPSQRTHAAKTGSLPLFSAFISSLQSPGN